MHKDNITTSYMRFYNRIIAHEFTGYSFNGLKHEFIASVKKADYCKSDLDEICEYLLKLI